MKTKIVNKAKLWLTFVLFVMMSLCLLLGFGAMGRFSAKAADEVKNVRMRIGGGFRFEEPFGLGFYTEIDYEYYNTLAETNDVKTGTLFIRKNDAKKAEITLTNETFTIASLDAANAALSENAKFTYKAVGNSGWLNADSAAEDGYYVFRGSVVGIKQFNMEKDYCARGYLAYKAKNSSDEWTYEYTDYNEDDHSRSIETLAEKALETSDTQTDEFSHEIAEGVYSRYSAEMRSVIEPYAPKANGQTIFEANSDTIKYLYWTNSSSATEYTQYATADTGISATAKENTALTGLDLNGYTGSAIEFTNLDRRNQTYVKLPSKYEQENANAYGKIAIWYAVGLKDNATWEKPVYLNKTSYITGADVKLNTTGYEYNKFHYVELDLPTVGDAFWEHGYLRLWQIWSDPTALEGGDDVFKSEYTFYLGSVSYITKEAVAEKEELEKQKKAQILNNLTADNYKQYELADRNSTDDRVFLSNDDVSALNLGGGYTGAAVQFRPGGGKSMTISYPAGLQYLTDAENADGLYLTVWVAVKTHVENSTMTGKLQLADGPLFDKNITYAYNNTSFVAGNDVKFDTSASLGYAIDTWYQLYIPLSKAVANNTTGVMTILKLYYDGFTGEKGDQDNFRLLVGNIAVENQKKLDEVMPKVPSVLEGLTAENYTKYELVDRNDGTDRAFLESTSLAGGYTGPAVQFRPGSGKVMTIAHPAGLENLTDAESADGLYLTLWVAVKTHVENSTMAGGLKFANGVALFDKNITYARNNASFTAGKNVQFDASASLGYAIDTWYQLYIPLSNAVKDNTEGKLTILKLEYNGFTSDANGDQDNFRLLIGQIGVATQADLDALKNPQ